MIKTLLLSRRPLPRSLGPSCLPRPRKAASNSACSTARSTAAPASSSARRRICSCTFNPADQSFAPEAYFGAVSKWGIDIGTTDQAVMRWLVLAPSSNIYAPGALAGDYVGASAEVTAAVGAGANLLVGGSNGTFTLQPLSVQTQTGLNLAVGVTSFQLRSMRQPSNRERCSTISASGSGISAARRFYDHAMKALGLAVIDNTPTSFLVGRSAAEPIPFLWVGTDRPTFWRPATAYRRARSTSRFRRPITRRRRFLQGRAEHWRDKQW